jgi:hypothetical protein
MKSILNHPINVESGQILVITLDSYSDYKVQGIFRVLKSISRNDMIRLLDGMPELPLERTHQVISAQHDIILKLIASGYIESLSSAELNLQVDYDREEHPHGIMNVSVFNEW